MENLVGNWESDYLAEITKIEKETGLLDVVPKLNPHERLKKN